MRVEGLVPGGAVGDCRNGIAGAGGIVIPAVESVAGPCRRGRECLRCRFDHVVRRHETLVCDRRRGVHHVGDGIDDRRPLRIVRLVLRLGGGNRRHRIAGTFRCGIPSGERVARGRRCRRRKRGCRTGRVLGGLKTHQLRLTVATVDVRNRLGRLRYRDRVAEVLGLRFRADAGIRHREYDGFGCRRRGRAGNDAVVERETAGKRTRLLHERVGRRAAAHRRRKRLFKRLADICRESIRRLRQRLRPGGLERKVLLSAQGDCAILARRQFRRRIRARPGLYENSFAYS